MLVKFKNANQEELKSVGTLVVFVGLIKTTDKTNAKIASSTSNSFLQEKIRQAFDEKMISAKKEELVFFRLDIFTKLQNVLIVGLGVLNEVTAEDYRRASAVAINSLNQHKIKSAEFLIDELRFGEIGFENFARAFIEGALLADYRFQLPLSLTQKKKSKYVEELFLRIKENPESENASRIGHVIAEATNIARNLGDLPSNLKVPVQFAELCLSALKNDHFSKKLKIEIWDKARIEKEKMSGLLGVSSGSSNEPKFIVIEYNKGDKKPIALTGKAVTFDSGGLSLKSAKGMEQMKYDMCGGAAVLASIWAIAKLDLNVHILGLIPVTENMPGASAIKPGDIIISRNGKTIEVNNTDAEGRLILADALAYASERNPEYIINVATLTGAVTSALGNTHVGFFTRNQKLRDLVAESSYISGENVWQLPLSDFNSKDIKGHFADLKNTSSQNGAGSSSAAAFLEQFVDKEIPWVHFDIAGTAYNIGHRYPYCPKVGASGMIVRTLIQIIMEQAKTK